MKKFLLVLGIVAVAFGMTSCNSKSDPWGIAHGSLEEGSGFQRIIEGVDGTKFTIESGYEPFPELPSGVYRQFVGVAFNYDDGNFQGFGKGKTLPIRPYYYEINKTIAPTALGESSYDDKLIFINGESSSSAMGVAANFLYFTPVAQAYMKSSTEVAAWQFNVEIDPEIVSGAQNDTINMHLKFFVNEQEDKEPIDWAVPSQIYGNNCAFIAVDLNYAPALISDPLFNQSKDYIIKLNYETYKITNETTLAVDKNVVYKKYITCKWTPSEW